MATVRILLGIICLAVFGQFIEPGGYFLGREGVSLAFRRLGAGRSEGIETRRCGAVKAVSRQLTNSKLPTENRELSTDNWKLPTENRKPIIAIAQAQLGVREATGKNDGVQVERYLRYTGNKKGAPWCAAFISWVFGRAGHAQPKTAWSPGLFPLARQRISPQPGDVFGIYFAALGRIAHCGLVEGQRDNWISTIEGNTNIAGSREGDGVYRKLRHKRTIKFYADWIDKGGQQP